MAWASVQSVAMAAVFLDRVRSSASSNEVLNKNLMILTAAAFSYSIGSLSLAAEVKFIMSYVDSG